MTVEMSEPRPESLVLILRRALRAEIGRVELETACAAYAVAGYEVTSWLRDFLERYSELLVDWSTPRGLAQLDTRVETALEAYPHNVRVWGRQLGKTVLPVGTVFYAEDHILLSDDDEVFIAGPGGFQRIGYGFEESLSALIADAWDKTLFDER